MPVTCAEMKRIEEAAFARGVQAEDLMEQAGLGLAEIVRQFHPQPGTCVVFCGKGHNGGDALVAARHLASWGWNLDLRFAVPELAPLTAKKRHELPAFSSVATARPLVVLDGLLGIGAKGEPRAEVASAIDEINRLRREDGAWVLAIDIPSGLDGDTGVPAAICVQSDLTATIACVKDGLVADAATDVVGRLAVVPLSELAPPDSPWSVATAPTLRHWLPPRHFDMHKGDCGRIGIVAGSPGFLGAARMCSAAAVHGGAGLITVYVRPEIASLLAPSVVPEVMVKTVSSYREIWRDHLDVIAIGPGLGRQHDSEVLSLLREAPQPMVVDADALNALSADVSLLGHSAGPRLLTPHPGEMERLFPRSRRSRRDWLEDFTGKYPVALLLKGARTVIGSATGGKFYNATGDPGMASGGMGDVLTGVCAALAAQIKGDDALFRAGVLGAWICGRAAEIAVYEPGGSAESLSATAVIDHLGTAFRDLRAGAC